MKSPFIYVVQILKNKMGLPSEVEGDVTSH